MRLFSGLLFAALTLRVASAHAHTYVEEPAFGRSVMGVAVYGGTPIGSSTGDDRASVLGGGGTDLLLGYAWEGGLSLHGVFGAAKWSPRGPLASSIGDRDATLLEASAGLALRWVPGDRDFGPYVQSQLVVETLRVRGSLHGDAFGYGVGAQLGMRIRNAPWDGFLALDLRHARFPAPTPVSTDVHLTRVALVLGVFFDLY